MGASGQALERRRRVAAARLAAERRSAAPFVREARRAASLRDLAERFRADCRACRDNAVDEAELRGSSFNA